MKTMKKILSALLVVVMCLTSAPLGGLVGLGLPEWNWKASAVDEYKEGYYTYTVTNGKATITDVDASISGDVVIPSTLGGYSVTTIGGYAFYYCDSLTSVTIPDSVTTIGDRAFYYCYSLTSVTIPDSVTTIGDRAFADCYSLTSITIPDSVTTIGDRAFCYCYSLTSVTIPDSVTTIGDRAFYHCYSLTSVTIPDSVTTIGDWAFYSCDSFTSITIPDSVTTIGVGAFYSCDSFTSITIPDSVTTIGVGAFNSCDSLTNIVVDADNPFYSNDSRGTLFDKNKTILIQYPIGNTNSSYSIPDSVTTIGDYAFDDCDSLTSVTIPDSVTTIGDYAFYGCDSLTSITIPDSVTTIGEYAFCYCSSLTSVTIPDSVTTIGVEAFKSCDSLTSIVVDADNHAYSSDSRGTLFDKNKTILIQYPIGNTNSSYSIPDSVTTIGDYAFYYCDSLTSVTIPDSVTTIGNSAFFDCNSLTDVYYNGTEEQWKKIYMSYDNEPLLNATIHFLGEDEPNESKPDGYKLKLWSDGAYSDSIAVGESIGFDVYLLENGKYLDCERPYAVSFDVQGVFEVSQIKTSSDSMYIKLRANKAGTTNMTISDNVTGAYVTVKLKADNKIKALTLYEFDDSAKKQDDILTHIYNQNGIYINGFNVNENKDGSYHVVMNAYNEKAHYGAVVAYDKDGNITDYDLIKQKKKLPTNLWSGTFDVFDWVTYKFEVFGEKPYTHLGCTQWTPVDVNVPKDGHLVITNNTANEMAFLANMTDLAIDFAFAYVDFIFDDIPENTSDKVIEITIGQLIKKMGEKALSKFCSDFIEKLTVKMTFANISTVLNNFVEALEDEGIDFYDIVVEALGDTVNEELFYNIGEDIGLLLAGGPIQDILKACDYTNTLIKMYDMGGSILSPQTIVKAPPAEEKVRISNGVTVTSEKPLDPKYVLHTYVINQNDDLMTDAVPTIDPLADNYNMYDITLYKSGEAVQPDAKIKVMIPIPAGYDKSRISVYWYKEDGTLEKMNAIVNGSYAIFETDHLSCYVLVEEHVHIYGEDEAICTDCGFDRTESCNHNCHRMGIAGLFWKIINFFNKIFKIKQYCDCGIKHY